MALQEGASSPKRLSQACLNCRRKKVRCPGEKPVCSSCARLRQNCHYGSTSKQSSHSRPVEDRLAYLEEQLSLVLNGTRNDHVHRQSSSSAEVHHVAVTHNDDTVVLKPSLHSESSLSSDKIVQALELYFKYCHRNPIWCIERNDVEDVDTLPREFAYALMTLTSRFADDVQQPQQYVKDARHAIMSRLADGGAGLPTIESLCLLSYSFYLDEAFQQGHFHLGLAHQLCQAALMDFDTSYNIQDSPLERKKRIFWSCQILEQLYGRQTGILRLRNDIWRPSHLNFDNVNQPSQLQTDIHSHSPPFPVSTDELPDVWVSTIHLGWAWARIREYTTDAAQNCIIEPWRNHSAYAAIVSDLLELENRTPMCHRYDSVKFYERDSDELNQNLTYWTPWLKAQFTYHACKLMLNHPFLYIAASQRNSNLAIPNTFWRRSTEVVLVHATWIVRMVDMVAEKRIELVDPFFAHAAAMAATVHLYYCCASDQRLRSKSIVDLRKARDFLKTFTSFSLSCETLVTKLNNLIQIAAGSVDIDSTEWAPTKIQLNVRLMWDILTFNCSNVECAGVAGELLHSSLSPSAVETPDEASTFEIIVAISPEVSVNISDGGQAAPVASTSALIATPNAAGVTAQDDILVAPSESLRVPSSWLWTDQSLNTNMTDDAFYDFSNPTIGNAGGFNFWDLANL